MLRTDRCFGALLISVLATLVGGPSWAGPFDDPGHDPITVLSWATWVEDFEVGPMDIASPELGPAHFGAPANTLGPATHDAFDVFALGDGGFITLGLPNGIGDGPGNDFAIWENSFYSIGGLFAELAFVEVSTDGLSFLRLPAATTNQEPAEGLVTVDPSDYHNLAGDQPLGLGTGFDLFDLVNEPLVASGLVDLDEIHFVRVIDVIGDGKTFDASGQPIYDPYPTPFASGGFDLEAVGVLHEAPEPALALSLWLGSAGLLGLARRRAGNARCMRAL